MNMKNAKLLTLAIIFISFPNCQKEEQHSLESEVLLNSNPDIQPAIIPLVCDDVTAFKSSVDLEPLVFLQDCFSCTATKEVPGLGSISWVSNGIVRSLDDKLYLNFQKSEQNFELLFRRETLNLNDVPMSIGTYVVHDNFFWQQNMEGPHGGYYRLLDDGDVLDAGWSIDTTCLSFIEITQLDLECKEVRGKFEVHLQMVQQGQAGTLYSERINFLNGEFYARIIQL
jgi:hypothetical protein